VPHPIEWLSDNGSAYIARETRQIATALGLRLAFTPVRSPESNGISEAFVKTLKRDYARISILTDAATTMALLPGWFEDYNTVHPALRPVIPLASRVPQPQCLTHPATCPVKWGALQL
jgi:transposase InsO family protein